MRSVQPGRIKQLRLSLGITQAAFADLIGRTSGTVSKWESGFQAPDSDAARRLCDVFDISENWLLEAPFTAERSTPFFFRSQSNTTNSARDIAGVRLEWLQEVVYKLQESLEFPPVNVPHLAEINCELISDQEIEQIASDCRQAWGLGFAPIPDVVQVMENVGIVCARTSLGYLKVEGVSNWHELDQRPYVLLVDDKANGIRSRFDAAHELGHIVLHRYVTQEHYKTRHALLEAQAHRFASAFLLPAERFSREVRWPTPDTLLELKPRWKVSVAAMITRCQELAMINDTTATRLWCARAARGWAKGEPMEADFEFERPKVVGRGVKMLVENKVLSRLQVRRLLGLPVGVLERLCHLEEGYFDSLDKPQVVELLLRQKARPKRATGGVSANILGFHGRG
ncbi:helix-turn-helix domain-containing protein [Pseudomonas sp.]|uniref:helix-turn-helix domain-containing protein n=1 Tax=Pseudomonas sp. TaxID=306 RepID=UPI003F96C4A4